MTLHFNRTSEREKRRALRKRQTLAEEIIWQNVRNRKFLGYKFRRQYSVDCFIIDFYCPKLKLALEIDGSVHDTEEAQQYDARRQKYIEEFGIKFLRIRNEEILSNGYKALSKLADKINELENNNI